jgi:hypothetical protein
MLNLVKLVDLVEAEIKDEYLALITPDQGLIVLN